MRWESRIYSYSSEEWGGGGIPEEFEMNGNVLFKEIHRCRRWDQENSACPSASRQ